MEVYWLIYVLGVCSGYCFKAAVEHNRRYKEERERLQELLIYFS